MLKETQYNFAGFIKSNPKATLFSNMNSSVTYTLTAYQNDLKTFNTFNLYRDYIKWLVTEKNKLKDVENTLSAITVCDLFFQIQVINAYVIHEMQKRLNNTANNGSSFDPAPEHCLNQNDHSEKLKPIIDEHFKQVDTRVFNAVTNASTQSFKSHMNIHMIIPVVIGAALFGVSYVINWLFAPLLFFVGIACMAYGFGAGVVRYFADTSSPEVMFRGEPLFPNHRKMDLSKREAMLDTVSVKKSVNNSGVWDQDHPIMTTSKAISAVLFPGLTTAIANKPILSTVYSLTEARFSPFYEARKWNDKISASDTRKIVKKENGNAQQLVDLDALSASQQDPVFNRRIDTMGTQL